MHLTRKHITIAVIALLLILLAGRAIWLLMPDPIKVYDVGYVFYDYENDTDFIHPDAPYINVGGRVYFLAKENWYGGALKNVCQILSYIDYETGIPYSICESKTCIHNTLDYTRNCRLANFTSDLVIDDQGWIYGVYHPGVLKTDTYFQGYGAIQDRTQDPGVPELGRFNLYDQSYQTLYLYEADTTQYGYLVTDSIGGIRTSYQYVYFFEHLAPGWNGGSHETWFRRYDITTNQTTTLAEMSEPAGFYAFGDNLYFLEEGGLYRYDLDYSPESRVCMLDLSSAFFAGGKNIANIQYDSYSQMIYFLRQDGRSSRLCRIRGYGYDQEAAVVDRIPDELPLAADVEAYQLTDDCIYFTRTGKRLMGQWTDMYNIRHDKYAPNDGCLYSLTYTQCLADQEQTGTLVWDDTSLYFDNWTVIGNYLYGEEFGECELINHGSFYESAFDVIRQIRLDLTTGRIDTLKLTNWNLQ